MSVLRRVALVVAAPVVLIGFFAVAWGLLPGPNACISVSCGPHYDPGGANVFGHEDFTIEQSIVMALGIWMSAAVFGSAVLPATRRRTAAGFGLLSLALVIAFTLPSPETGPAPSTPCFTPGPSGPIVGGCQTGPPPIDERFRDRVLVAGAGLLALGAAAAVDRRRGVQTRPTVATPNS
jgi:hypothetical protein